MSLKPELSIVIPLFNEERNVEVVTKELVAELEVNEITYELILVDNGSFDRTSRIIEELVDENPRIKPIYLSQNQGYGGGILAGLSECNGRYIGYMWGDRQVVAKDVIRIFKKLKDEGLDLCKSIRIERHDGLKRKIITKAYNFIFPFFFSVSSRDINGCPKMFKSERFYELNITLRDWFIDPEIMVKSQKRNFKIGEVPVIFYSRNHGSSNVRLCTVFEFIKNMIYFKFKGIL
ncbi:MAG: glycosyltransferase family 2 protein [Candidatus Scalinduaceae bacterium]